MTLNDNLQASLRQLVLDHLPYDRQDAEVVRELNAMTPSQLLIRWLNWTRRMVPPRPRQVFQSTELPIPSSRRERLISRLSSAILKAALISASI